MATEAKTVPTGASVTEFLANVEDPGRRTDTERVCTLMQEITGEPPVMWGPSIIGFGQYDFRSPAGRTGIWMRVGVSPRKANLSLYITTGFEAYGDLLAKLGKHKIGVGCLYIKRLSDVDEAVLRELIASSVSSTPVGAE